ncbi:hypothetical protein GCM10010521_74710 [Streptomyces rameus]|uniref:Uncharacterized protein n=2 Tax=Streptomyces TaxID=1883 RepID=A0ABN3V9S9_9ACTN
MITGTVDHGMKPRTALGAIVLTAMPLLLATPAQAAAPGTPHKPALAAAQGPVGPGLSDLVAIAEGVLRGYGITKTFADILDLDAGQIAFASEILGNGPAN